MVRHYIRRSSRKTLRAFVDEHRIYLEEMLFDAVVTAGTIVAFADGRADETERS